MTFRSPTKIRQIALRTVALICVLLLNANALALAHFDAAGFPGVAFEIHSEHPDGSDGSAGHESHQCNFGKNLNLRDSFSHFVPPARKDQLFDGSPDFVVGQLSAPLLRPPKT